MKFVRRRAINFFLLCTVSTLVFWAASIFDVALNYRAFYSGWLLFGLLLAMFLLTLRKKILAARRLLKVSFWMQLHVYVGLLAVVVFLLHAGGSFPDGTVKRIVYLLFVTEAVSGVLGLFINRTMPVGLDRNGPMVLYHEIDSKRQQVLSEVESLVEKSLAEHDSNLIAVFFRRSLLPFLIKPRHVWAHVLQLPNTLHALNREFIDLQHFLNEEEQGILNRIQVLVIEKDRLDYQYAGQSLLKYWLFVHVPVSYSLLLFIALHVLVVYAYIGGV